MSQIQQQRLKSSVERVTIKLVFTSKLFRTILHALVKVVTTTQGKHHDRKYRNRLQIELLSIIQPYKAHLLAYIAFVETHYPQQFIKNLFEELLPIEAFHDPSINLTNLTTLLSLINSIFYYFKQGKVDLAPEIFFEPMLDDMDRRNIPEAYQQLLQASISPFREKNTAYCTSFLTLFMTALQRHPDIGVDVQVWRRCSPVLELLNELLPELIDPRRILHEEKFNRILGSIKP